MKNLILFSSLLFFAACKPNLDAVRKVDKEYRSAPPGTVWIRDSIYMDQCEVRNLDYLEYVRWLKKIDSSNYEKALPDTTVWLQKLNFCEPYMVYYFSHPAYRKYPVVGISYEQILDFCKWRTDRVKEFAKLISATSKFGASYKNSDYYYRLPTKEEWEYAAYSGSSRPYGFASIHTKDNLPNFNVKETETLGYNNGIDIVVPSFSMNPNKFGLYNTIGNVAEMISEKGVSKGGSWFDSLEDCEINDSIKYEKPAAWLGFRCVCVVTK